MKANSSSFTFVGYEANIQKGTVIFSYELTVESKLIEFHETLQFTPSTATISKIQPFLDALLLMLGISYWKTYCPATIIILPFTLTRKQADFWNLVYTKGLGEFYYKNNIDYRGLVQFPFDEHTAPLLTGLSFSDKSLVLLGGGKDSIVTAELLKQQGKKYSLFALNPVELQKEIAQLIGKDLLSIRRVMDPQLFDLNRRGVYNGHVSITAMYSLFGVFAAALYDFRYVIVSNEASANYGNVEYFGGVINHQWSKSFEFESAFQIYIHEFITPNITYFSLLRPIQELEIMKLFTKYPKYFPAFSSCNTNFKVSGNTGGSLWCGICPKCAFVFLLLSSLLSKTDVIKIFNKNLFTDASLFTLYKELLGLEGFKPFECVGTPEESRIAFARVIERGEYTDDVIVKLITPMLHNSQIPQSMNASVRHEHIIPSEFSDIIPFL
jgi:hypothetical protein